MENSKVHIKKFEKAFTEIDYFIKLRFNTIINLISRILLNTIEKI